MRIKNLKLKNIGPFNSSELNFISNADQLENPPVIIITGENGTGKSIILDAIRSLFMGIFENVEREITSTKDFLMESDISINNLPKNIRCVKKNERNFFDTNQNELSELFHSQFKPGFKKDFVFDYWTSKLSQDSFNISSISAFEPEKYLNDALKGIHKNVDVTKIISFFDYLKDSKNDKENTLGKSLYEILEKIINISIIDGELSHVSRITLKPIIKIKNKEISLDKLSSGNLYLIQRLTSLLRQIYSICVINELPVSDYKKIKGVLLIDEAENHLHPKWQKTFLNNIQSLFPGLQLIVTTHSPFIVSSVENSRIFVCTGLSDHSIVEEQTDLYANKPIEEILISPLFNTTNFNKEISELMNKRKKAQFENNVVEVRKIENILLDKNPEYFNYLNIEKLIKTLNR